jgi:hypothetical protein
VKQLVEASFAQIAKAVPCFQFTDVGWKAGSSMDAMSNQFCNKGPAIFFMSNPNAGCYSYVGQLDYPSQQVQLHDPGCLSMGTVIHEIGHALGMAHEHIRSDRDKAVWIDFSNIIPGFESQFEITPSAYIGAPYDILSVMQYDAYSFAHDVSQPTIVCRDPNQATGIGQRSGLSQGDVDQFVAMYLGENPTCGGSTIAGIGCIDSKDENGIDICTGITSCDAVTMQLCCACDGGISVQCYKDEPCNQPEKLPPPDDSACIVDQTGADPTWSGQFGCIVANICDYAVKFTCASTPSCSHDAAANGYFFYDCQGYRVYEICEDPSACKVVRSG